MTHDERFSGREKYAVKGGLVDSWLIPDFYDAVEYPFLKPELSSGENKSMRTGAGIEPLRPL
jgi:hypothetical protein